MRGIKLSLLATLLAATLGGVATQAQVHGNESSVAIERQSWSFWGPFGGFDKGQLQRGYKIYEKVCSSCHSMNLVAFRNLGDPDGPAYAASTVKAKAASYKIKDGPNDAGDMFERPGLASDHFPWNFANPQAAAAALGGKAPPDMSLLAKARSYPRPFPMFLVDPLLQYQEKGPDYIVALLTKGYAAPAPEGKEPPAGSYFNAVYPGGLIAMANPLDLIFDAGTEKPSDPEFYTDGTVPTRAQVAKDISAFLMWTAEPKLEERHRTGFIVMIFLAVFAFLLLMVKRRVWAGLHDGAH